MRQYQSYKKVMADKIVSINRGQTSRLYMKDGDFADVPLEWMDKHKPQVGWYFVRYPDGYESCSPAEAFEKGYEEFDRRKTLEGYLELETGRNFNVFTVFAICRDVTRIQIKPTDGGEKLLFRVEGNHLIRE